MTEKARRRIWITMEEAELPSPYQLNLLALVAAEFCSHTGEIEYGIDRLGNAKEEIKGGAYRSRPGENQALGAGHDWQNGICTCQGADNVYHAHYPEEPHSCARCVECKAFETGPRLLGRYHR